MSTPPFAHAHQLIDRATEHEADFGRHRGRDSFWSTRVANDDPRSLVIVIDRERIRRLKPIAGDVVHNVVSAADNILAAMLRLNNQPRARHTFSVTNDHLRDQSAILAQDVGQDFVDLITDHRNGDPIGHASLELLKAMNNDAKHWELDPFDPNLAAFTIRSMSGAQIVEIPKGHFRSNDTLLFRLDDQIGPHVGIELLAGFHLRVKGETHGMDPQSAFRSGIPYVRQLIHKTERLAGV